MRLQFDPMADDDDRFFRVQEQLVGELRVWASDRFGDTEGLRASWTGTFLQWKYNYGDGRLDDVSPADVREFLLEWCPAKVAAGPESAPELVDGVSAYVEFMADTGRLVGGFAAAAELMALMGEMTDDVASALADPAKFGMGKSLFSPPAGGDADGPLADLFEAIQQGALSEGGLQRLLDERMAAFNALPHEERKRLTDHAVRPPEVQRVQLSFVHVAPPVADVEASALQSRLLTMVDRLVEWLGPKGRAVTQTGAFKLADARELVAVLGTGDKGDEVVLSRPRKIRSSRELRVLSWVADVAEDAGAVTVGATKMTREARWADQPVTERARRLVDSVFATGVLGASADGTIIFDQMWQLLDDGVPHWLLGVLAPGQVEDLDEIVERAIEVCTLEFPGYRERWGGDSWDRFIERDVHRLFDALELTGLVELRGCTQHVDRYGFTETTGGSFTGTALLRWLLPKYAHAAGYDFAELGELETAEPATVAAAFMAGDLELEAIIERWLSGVDPGERDLARARALADLAAFTTEPHERVAAFRLLEHLVRPADAADAVRELLDTPAAGHAAMYLLSNDLASSDEVGTFVSIGPLVDHLSLLVDEPETVAELFTYTQERAIDDLLDDMWRHDQPETLLVLETLGASTRDKKLAKNARKAALKHRSWLADRRQRHG